MGQSVNGMLAITVAGTLAIGVSAACGLMPPASAISHQPAGSGTATPIRHIVVIFQENVSFDHYFGTCPNAANTDGQPFRTKPGTPRVNGLDTRSTSCSASAARTPGRSSSTQRQGSLRSEGPSTYSTPGRPCWQTMLV